MVKSIKSDVTHHKLVSLQNKMHLTVNFLQNTPIHKGV